MIEDSEKKHEEVSYAIYLKKKRDRIRNGNNKPI